MILGLSVDLPIPNPTAKAILGEVTVDGFKSAVDRHKMVADGRMMPVDRYKKLVD